jgi:hypothetical protein
MQEPVLESATLYTNFWTIDNIHYALKLSVHSGRI